MGFPAKRSQYKQNSKAVARKIKRWASLLGKKAAGGWLKTQGIRLKDENTTVNDRLYELANWPGHVKMAL